MELHRKMFGCILMSAIAGVLAAPAVSFAGDDVVDVLLGNEAAQARRNEEGFIAPPAGSTLDGPSWEIYATYVSATDTRLVGADIDERHVPYRDTSLLNLGPTGSFTIRRGMPPAQVARWRDLGETNISYIRPHANVQVLLNITLPSLSAPGDFQFSDLKTHAVMNMNHDPRVDSRRLGRRESLFGGSGVKRDKPRVATALAGGIDIGLLPTFLTQMGINLGLAISRDEESGATEVALVATTEVATDWIPTEIPEMHPRHNPVPLVTATGQAAQRFGSGSFAGTRRIRERRPRGPQEPPPIPLEPEPEEPPVIPEPATAVTLLIGAAALFLKRRRSRR
ncbi:MAG: PEP-CTERM sorting domain-containing protein [Planctomycetia bacterium]|nr:PEP-CTERM sorting domain-containing protein [Planctomycetia bacterium]